MNKQSIFMMVVCSWLLMLSGCAVNPATGTPDVVLMSEAAEIAKGKELHEKMLKSMPVYQDDKLMAYIERIGQKLVKHSHRANIPYHFTIIDSPDINAFALPGGYIYINRGLLAYLDSEAQLAAVIAHEIAHVTARHVVRQDAARKGAGVLSVLSVFTTGSAVLGDVTNLMSSAAVKGYGREMELEADALGAEYLFNTGYDPKAMVDTIGVLKDQEKFARYRAKEEGRKHASYHGVFSTHPRNDIRLKDAIAKAGEFPQHLNTDNKVDFRQHTEGLVYGINFDAQPQVQAEKGRYHHQKLGFSLLFPEAWQVENTRQAIVGQPEDKSASIVLEVAKNTEKLMPPEYLRHATGASRISRSEDFSQFGLIGSKGIVEATTEQPAQRVAVIFQGSRAYLLTAKVAEGNLTDEQDQLFLKTIHSFRPERASSPLRKSKTLHYVKANDNTTMALLAKQLNLGVYAEQQLRLINGLYPRGEPKAGDWIKIIR